MRNRTIKTAISIFLCIMFAFSMVPVAFAQDPASYYEDFEDFDLNEYTTESNYTVTLGRGKTGNGLNVYVSTILGGKNVSYAGKLAAKGRVTMEFDYKSNATFTLMANFGEATAELFTYRTDGTGVSTGTYVGGNKTNVYFDKKGGSDIAKNDIWYHVRIDMNLASSPQTYTYTIDGKKGKNLDATYTKVIETLALPSGCETFTGFGVYGQAYGATAVFDNIDIYSGNSEVQQSKQYTAADRLAGLGIIDEIKDSKEPVTKAEFIKMLIRGMGLKPVESTSAAEFSDITDHPDKAYFDFAINAGIINGKGDGTVGADDIVDLGTASKMAVSALGYVEHSVAKGGYIAGYMQKARDLKLLTGVDGSDSFTFGDATEMIWNFLNARPYEYYDKGMEPYLYGGLNIDRLVANVTSVDREDMYIELDVFEKNGNDVSERKSFKLPIQYETMNLEDMTVEVYVDSNNKIVYIEPYGGGNAVWGYVWAINDSSLPTAELSASEIGKIILADGRMYKVDSGAQLFVNGVNAQKAVIRNAFVNLVIENDKVVKVNIYRDRLDPAYGSVLEEGGIITSVLNGNLQYTKGSQSNLVLGNIDISGNRCIVNGVLGTYKLLRTGMLFDYMQNADGSYVIVATRTGVDGTITEMGGNSVMISDTEYLLSDRTVYIKHADEFAYSSNVDVSGLLGKKISAMTDACGQIRYIEIKDDIGEFYGIVTGGRNTSGLDTKKELRIFTKDGEEIYEVEDRLEDGYGFVDYETAASNAGDVSGKGVYKFYISDTGKIYAIESINWIDDKPQKLTAFSDWEVPMVTVSGVAKYINNNIFALTNIDGEFEPKVIDYHAHLRSMFSFGTEALLAEPVGDEIRSDITVFTKGSDTVFSSGTVKLGLIKRVSRAINSDEEEVIRVTMVDQNGKDYSFDVPKDKKYFDVNGYNQTYKENDFIACTKPKVDGADHIVVAYLDLENLNTQNLDMTKIKTAHRNTANVVDGGTLIKIDDGIVYCSDKTASRYASTVVSQLVGYKYNAKEGKYEVVSPEMLIGSRVLCVNIRTDMFTAAIIGIE